MVVSAIRQVRVEGDIAYVPLSGGLEAVIDASDAGSVGSFNWNHKAASGKIYAIRSVPNPNGARQKTVYMHREILRAASGIEVDHRDGDGLNNRRSNLRPATREENNRNRKTRRDSVSGLKGVGWHPKTKKWRATIKANGARIHLGLHETREAAHEAYIKAAREYFGEFARAA